MLASMVALAACGGDKQPDAAAQAAKIAASAAKQHPASAAEQIATMVQAPTSGKATAPIQLRYELAQRPVAGQTTELSLALLASVAAQSVTLHFGDSPGLVFPDPADLSFGAVVPDTVYRQAVKLSAPAEGVYFIAATATITHDSTVETRSYSIPIIVSPP